MNIKIHDSWKSHLKNEFEKDLKFVGFKIEKIWQATHYCLPFSHFLLYGIGKNLVEKGFLNSFK